MKTCFIIMPISTPEHSVAKYSGDKDHFQHVQEHLLIPAVKKADLGPIPPTAQGSDIIQAKIIKHLEEADLVLCDISTLNPNVFFELGIRTALNKPVCFVKDNLTKRVPFDTGIINHHEYRSDLALWTNEKEIERLAQHISESIKPDKTTKSLWEYFSLSSAAQAIEHKGDEADRLDYLTLQIESLKNTLKGQQLAGSKVKPLEERGVPESVVKDLVDTLAQAYGLHLAGVDVRSEIGIVFVTFRKPPAEESLNRLRSVLSVMYDYNLYVN